MLILTLFRLPVRTSLHMVGWIATSAQEVIHIQAFERGDSKGDGREIGSPLVADIHLDKLIEPASEEESGSSEVIEPPPREVDAERLPRLERISHRQVLQFAERMPDVAGGLGSLYLRINYPRAAQESGIQGLVVLGFIVEIDGSVSDLQILQPLHPLLDSAAVRAVRTTRFVPGMQGEEYARVAMKLPIRFQLIGAESDLAQGARNTSER